MSSSSSTTTCSPETAPNHLALSASTRVSSAATALTKANLRTHLEAQAQAQVQASLSSNDDHALSPLENDKPSLLPLSTFPVNPSLPSPSSSLNIHGKADVDEPPNAPSKRAVRFEDPSLERDWARKKEEKKTCVKVTRLCSPHPESPAGWWSRKGKELTAKAAGGLQRARPLAADGEDTGKNARPVPLGNLKGMVRAVGVKEGMKYKAGGGGKEKGAEEKGEGIEEGGWCVGGAWPYFGTLWRMKK